MDGIIINPAVVDMLSSVIMIALAVTPPHMHGSWPTRKAIKSHTQEGGEKWGARGTVFVFFSILFSRWEILREISGFQVNDEHLVDTVNVDINSQSL